MARHVLVKNLTASDHVVVVGAGLAGWRFVEALRREGFLGKVTLIGDERHAPYDRPPLSKNVLVGKWGPEKTTLATPEHLDQNDVTLRLGVAATGLDVAATTVHLSDGSSVQGSWVVVATGSRARLLGYSADSLLHTIRSRDDLERLETALADLGEGSTIAVIGGGFIGAEAATALRTRGFEPIVLEVAQRPLLGVLGAEVSLWLEGLAAQAGVELRTSQRIEDVKFVEGDYVVSFEDDVDLLARAVIVGAGAIPNVEWLATSGLEIDNGVVVDENLLAASRVAAIGDVARFAWPNVFGSEQVRIEHWQVSNDHAAHLARVLVTGEAPSAPLIPYFWSDQYGKKIQMLGHPRVSDRAEIVNGSVEEGKWMALYSRDGVVSGAVSLSQPRALMLTKALLEERTSLEDALVRAPWRA
jgi:NADPH-dependent 2,4-dienoyl-CoA reductase/sulfur reductase-like enzyme